MCWGNVAGIGPGSAPVARATPGPGPPISPNVQGMRVLAVPQPGPVSRPGRAGRAVRPARVEGVRSLHAAEPQYPGDDGAADPAVRATLAAYAAGRGSEHAALTALAGSRLLVPVVA